MEPVEPGATTPFGGTTPHRTRSRRLMATAGLIGLPVVGSALVTPAVANADDSAADHVTITVSRTATGASSPELEFLSDGALVEAYLGAGYSYDDALVLARSWGVDDVYRTKVKAGQCLARGIALADTSFADPSADDGFGREDLAGLFLASGYSFEHATVLADNWGVDVGEAKVEAGRQLKTVGVLPFVDPGSPVAGADRQAARFAAFFDAGYDYDDGVVLADFWGLPDVADAKLKAGEWLLIGQPLPPMAGLGDGS